MNTELPSSDGRLKWPQSKGDPIGPVWSYAGKKRMYEAEALRMMAQDLVEHIRQLELPVKEAMREARSDGLHELVYERMMQKRVNGLELENNRLRRGEFVCKRCGIRKDADASGVSHDF
jgi:hypothetical protein